MGVAVSGSGYLGPPGRLWSVLLELRVPGALAAQVATPGGASGNCMAVRTMPWIWDLKGLIDFLGLLLGLLGWGAGSSLLPRCSEHPENAAHGSKVTCVNTLTLIDSIVFE